MIENRRKGVLIVFIGILLSALNLRAAVTSLSTIFAVVAKHVTGFNVTVAGTLPLIAFAVFGLLAPLLVRKMSYELALFGSMMLIAVGLGTRILMPNFGGFCAATVIALAGMAFGNTLLPPLFKRYYPDRIGIITAIYSVVLAVSAGIPSIISTDTATTLGWRFSLGVWAGVALLAAVPWLFQLLLHRDQMLVFKTTGVHHQRQQRYDLKLTLSVALLFGIGGMLPMYTMINWLPTYLNTVHYSAHSIGIMMFLYNILGIFHAIIVPIIMERMRHPYSVVVFAVTLQVSTFLGFLLLPQYAWVWVVVAAPGQLTVPAAFELFNLRSKTSAGAAYLSSSAQFIGYLLAAIGPVLFGSIHSATGGYTYSFVFLIIISLLTLIAGKKATRPGFVEVATRPDRVHVRKRPRVVHTAHSHA